MIMPLEAACLFTLFARSISSCTSHAGSEETSRALQDAGIALPHELWLSLSCGYPRAVGHGERGSSSPPHSQAKHSQSHVTIISKPFAACLTPLYLISSHPSLSLSRIHTYILHTTIRFSPYIFIPSLPSPHTHFSFPSRRPISSFILHLPALLLFSSFSPASTTITPPAQKAANRRGLIGPRKTR